MQMQASADDPGIGDVVVEYTEDEKEDPDVKGIPRVVRKAGRRDRNDRDYQRADQRNKFKYPRENAKEKSILQPDQIKPDGANGADDKAGNELCAGVRSERCVHILENAVGAQPPASSRKYPKHADANRV